MISVGESFASPGGIALETTFSINRLPAEEPGFTAGPDLPPFKIDSGVRKLRLACGEFSPWQAQHLA